MQMKLDSVWSIGEDIWKVWASTKTSVYLYNASQIIEIDKSSFHVIATALS